MNDPDDPSSPRKQTFLGKVVIGISDSINNNLILVRSGGIATITLLAAYGLSQTPIFFRYRTVCDIPSNIFLKRRSIHGRIVKIHRRKKQSIDNEIPIIIYIRHLSTVERFLSKSWFDLLLKYHPSRAFISATENDDDDDLLKIQLAGVVHIEMMNKSPLWTLNSDATKDATELLNLYASERAPVACQLIARKVTTPFGESVQSKSVIKRSILPNSITVAGSLTKEDDLSYHSNSTKCSETAVGLVFVKPKAFVLASRQDLGESLTLLGLATISKEWYSCKQNENIIDTSESVGDLRKDASYISRIGRAEFEACKGFYGIWSNEEYRKTRKDIVEEVEFQRKASVWRKLWKFIRGG